MTLENEIAFVSGASRGIGMEIALELGRQGAVVVGTATSETGAESISKYLKENNIKGTGVAMNVTEQAIEVLAGKGIKRVTPSPKDVKEFQAICARGINTLGEDQFSRKTLEEIRAFLKTLRKEN